MSYCCHDSSLLGQAMRDLAHKDHLISTREGEVRKAQRQVETLREEVRRQNQANGEKRKVIVAKDREIAGLLDRVAALKRKGEWLNHIWGMTHAALRRTNQEYRELAGIAQAIQEDNVQLEAQVEELQATLLRVQKDDGKSDCKKEEEAQPTRAFATVVTETQVSFEVPETWVPDEITPQALYERLRIAEGVEVKAADWTFLHGEHIAHHDSKIADVRSVEIH